MSNTLNGKDQRYIQHVDEIERPEEHPQDISPIRGSYAAVSQSELGDNYQGTPPKSPITQSQWKIYWLGPSILYCSFALGVGTAAAHHFLYNALDGSQASSTSQKILTFAGLALARLVSLFLTIAAAFSFRQWVWRLLRRRAIAIDAIDTLFVLDQSLFDLFLGWRAWGAASFAMVLAALLWSIQIPSLITPGSLSTTIHVRDQVAPVAVPSTQICSFGYTLSPVVNDLESGGTANLTASGCYAYYDMSNDRINTGFSRTVFSTAYSGQIPEFSSVCGRSNCSYSIDYVAPTLRCESAAVPDTLAGTSGHQYIDEYLTSTNLNDSEKFFLAYKGDSNHKSQQPIDFLRFNMTLLTSIDPIKYESYVCRLFNTSMTYSFSFSGSVSSQISLTREPDYSNEINMTALRTTDDIIHQSLITYWSQMTGLFTGLVQGIATPNGIRDGSGSSAQNSWCESNGNLSAARDTSLRRYIYTGPDRASAGYDPHAPGNAGTALEEISRNVSVTMTQIMNYRKTTDVKFSTHELVYQYDRAALLLSYAAAVVVCLVICLLGSYALRHNGIVSDFKFSTVLRTTRNPALEGLLEGTQLGAAPLPGAIGKTKLMFGIVPEKDGTSVSTKPAFGLKGQVAKLRKNAELH